MAAHRGDLRSAAGPERADAPREEPASPPPTTWARRSVFIIRKGALSVLSEWPRTVLYEQREDISETATRTRSGEAHRALPRGPQNIVTAAWDTPASQPLRPEDPSADITNEASSPPEISASSLAVGGAHPTAPVREGCALPCASLPLFPPEKEPAPEAARERVREERSRAREGEEGETDGAPQVGRKRPGEGPDPISLPAGSQEEEEAEGAQGGDGRAACAPGGIEGAGGPRGVKDSTGVMFWCRAHRYVCARGRDGSGNSMCAERALVCGCGLERGWDVQGLGRCPGGGAWRAAAFPPVSAPLPTCPAPENSELGARQPPEGFLHGRP
ncbi:hypothetical protein J1605_020925 [Eschrichtius robustus]|uniref:Uncharacterized protein n=1 Tax=Eschrichtius robustus TaxID=9764 RepID=A0AB34HGH9_ESCRO|nr:hypothetical protein J1605_020925 [Eschrichtius robustus]